MHVNILQYQHYLHLHGRDRELNRIILLTPNEGLSRQHLKESHEAGMDADFFSKDARSLFAGKAIAIIEITKLREEMGEKTVAIDASEGNNLILVDEGHRRSSGKETGRWMAARRHLCEQGRSFEYSAIFGQAMKASGNKALEQEYAKCILFDVINVGDASALCKLCGEHPDLLNVSDKDFSGSLFAGLNDAASSVHILIGSKKFT